LDFCFLFGDLVLILLCFVFFFIFFLFFSFRQNLTGAPLARISELLKG